MSYVSDEHRDALKWWVACEACDVEVRWIGTVCVRGMRERPGSPEGTYLFVTIRVCRNCAAKAILLPDAPEPGDIASDSTRWKWLYLNGG